MIVEMERPLTGRVRILLAKARFCDNQPMAPSEAETLLLDRDGPVATLTINRPDRLNAVTFAMFSRLPALLAEAEAMAGVRVLVLRGAGRRSFSAGADISEFETARTTPQQAAAYDGAVLAAEEALATFPAPTIAAIHGHCYGGGCALALACDLRFASSGARFAITPAKLGIVYPLRATKRLVNAVGPSRAKFILMSGIDIDAARAAAIGLVDEVDDDVDAAVATSPRSSPPAPASPSARSSRPSPASSTAPQTTTTRRRRCATPPSPPLTTPRASARSSSAARRSSDSGLGPPAVADLAAGEKTGGSGPGRAWSDGRNHSHRVKGP